MSSTQWFFEELEVAKNNFICHRCGGSTVHIGVNMPVSRLTAVMNMTASTKTGAILMAGGLIGKQTMIKCHCRVQ